MTSTRSSPSSLIAISNRTQDLSLTRSKLNPDGLRPYLDCGYR